MKTFLIVYDICDKKRLHKVAKIIYGYALGGQKSALETPLNKDEITKLKNKIECIIKKEDKVNIIPFEGKPAIFGKAKYIDYHNGVIII